MGKPLKLRSGKVVANSSAIKQSNAAHSHHPDRAAVCHRPSHTGTTPQTGTQSYAVCRNWRRNQRVNNPGAYPFSPSQKYPAHAIQVRRFSREILSNCLAAGEPYIAYGIHTLALYQASFLQSGDMARYCAPFTTDLIGYLPSTRYTPSIEKCLSIGRQDATTRSLSLDSASLVCSN